MVYGTISSQYRVLFSVIFTRVQIFYFTGYNAIILRSETLKQFFEPLYMSFQSYRIISLLSCYHNLVYMYAHKVMPPQSYYLPYLSSTNQHAVDTDAHTDLLTSDQ